MVQAHNYFPCRTVGIDAPPGDAAVGEWFLSNDASSTPSGAWTGFQPPFVATLDAGMPSVWLTQPPKERDVFHDNVRETLMVFDATNKYVKPSSQSQTGSLRVTTDASYTVGAGIQTVVVINTTAGAVTVTFPEIAALLFPRMLEVTVSVNSGGGTVSIAPHAGERIAGATGYTFVRVRDSVQVVSNTGASPKNWEPLFYSAHPHRLNDLDGGTATVDLATQATVVTNTITPYSGAIVTVAWVKHEAAAVTATAGVKADTVDEATAAAGVTADGVVLKDSTLQALNFGPKWVPGTIHYPCHMRAPDTTTTITAAAGTIVYLPYRVDRLTTIKKIYAHVTTAIAATNCRLAWFSDDGTGEPGNLVEGSSDIATTATGIVTFTLGGGGAVGLPGIYWTGFRVSSASVAFRGLLQANCLDVFGLGASPSALGNYRIQRIETGAYGAFPATAAPTGYSTGTAVLTAVEV